MTALLDAHAFLWFIAGNPKLSDTARSVIEEQTQTRLLSVVSLWEIALKHSLGRLTLAAPFGQIIPLQLNANGIGLLGIELEHLDALAKLPFHHRDPFDRLLIAQAIVGRIPIISADATFDAYPVTRLW
jgi:PIN domain nuclease of toxin-antitoxin system